jgi:hypothetical protein
MLLFVRNPYWRDILAGVKTFELRAGSRFLRSKSSIVYAELSFSFSSPLGLVIRGEGQSCRSAVHRHGRGEGDGHRDLRSALRRRRLGRDGRLGLRRRSTSWVAFPYCPNAQYCGLFVRITLSVRTAFQP